MKLITSTQSKQVKDEWLANLDVEEFGPFEVVEFSDFLRFGPALPPEIAASTIVYMKEVEGQTLVAFSVDDLLPYSGLRIDLRQLSTQLLVNPPALSRVSSPWRDIKCATLESLRPVRGNRDRKIRPTPFDANGPEWEKFLNSLRDSVNQYFERIYQTGLPVSADCSGGIDSTSLCFISDRHIDLQFMSHVVNADPQGEDYSFALRAQEEIGHPLVIFGNEVDFGGGSGNRMHSIESVSIGRVPTTAGDASRARETLTQVSDRGGHYHLTGIGGDELFDNYYAVAIDLFKMGKGVESLKGFKMALASSKGFSQKKALLANLRSPSKEFFDKVNSENRTQFFDASYAAAMSWWPGLYAPSFLTAKARIGIGAYFSENSVYVMPHFNERSKHHIFEAVLNQRLFLADVNEQQHDGSSMLCAPFLAPEVVGQILDLPVSALASVSKPKQALIEAFSEEVPSWVFSRRTKDSYSTSHYDYSKDLKPFVENLRGSSILVAEGLVDDDALKFLLDAPILDLSSADSLERFAIVECWLRNAFLKYSDLSMDWEYPKL